MARWWIASLFWVSLGFGVALGVAVRLAMRWIALESGIDPTASPGGTLEVVAFGALLGTPIALAFLLFRPMLRVPRPWAGLTGGLLLFGIVAAMPPPAARSALASTSDTPAFTAAAFAVVLVGWMVALEYAERIARRS